VSPPPAWTGFRPMQVSRIDRESVSVFSLVLVSADGEPLAAALPGQFVVLRLHLHPGAPPVLRSQTPPASGWLDEWGRLKGGHSLV
jgi:ferredoxin-NADP reductase